ncbi:MAG: hypothetical protein QME49_01970 [bacterium]|nr:hypothetical protein [bacterium]
MMKKRILFGIACCIWLSGCVTMDMAGRIIDIDTKEGLSDVAITLKDNTDREINSVTTDDKGGFIIHKVKKGVYQLTYKKDSVIMPETKPIDLNILSKNGARSLSYEVMVESAVHGKIIDKETNEPVEQAGVKLINLGTGDDISVDSRDINAVSSQEDGQYGFEYIQPAKYKIQIERFDYLWIETPVFVAVKGKTLFFDDIKLEKCPIEEGIPISSGEYQIYSVTIDGEPIIDNSVIR